MRISFVLNFILFVNIFVLNAQSYNLPSEHTMHYRIEVEVNPGVDSDVARRAFLTKPEIQIISWNPQAGVIELQTVPQVTPDILKSGLAEFQLKVKTIQILTQ